MMHEFDSAELAARENARIVRSAVSPRPIAWISTTSEEGRDNLAPFSSYTYVSASNPVVLFNSPNERHGGLKDTARNALDTGEFAVNVVTEGLLDEMDHSSAPIPSDESEFELTGVERAECRQITCPRVADALVTMECRLYDSMDIHDRKMVLGEVLHYHVSEDVLTDGKIDMRKIETVGRLGGPYYTVSNLIEFERRY